MLFFYKLKLSEMWGHMLQNLLQNFSFLLPKHAYYLIAFNVRYVSGNQVSLISASVRLQAPDCTVAQHIACAGLDEPPANDMWFCEQHRHKPSLKRSRSATQKKDSSVPLPSKKNGQSHSLWLSLAKQSTMLPILDSEVEDFALPQGAIQCFSPVKSGTFNVPPSCWGCTLKWRSNTVLQRPTKIRKRLDCKLQVSDLHKACVWLYLIDKIEFLSGAKVAKEALTQQNGTEQGKKPAAKRRRTWYDSMICWDYCVRKMCNTIEFGNVYTSNNACCFSLYCATLTPVLYKTEDVCMYVCIWLRAFRLINTSWSELPLSVVAVFIYRLCPSLATVPKPYAFLKSISIEIHGLLMDAFQLYVWWSEQRATSHWCGLQLAISLQGSIYF